MIKVYGLPTCPYCDYIEEQIKDRKGFIYINIGKNIKDLHDFLLLRDSRPEFDEYKKIGDVGVPCFVREDGSITLEPSEVGLHSLSEKTSCRIDGKGC